MRRPSVGGGDKREDALRASESRYRSLVETSPDAIVLLDLHGTIQMSNRQAAALFHHDSPETLLGRNAIGLLVPSDHERAGAALQATAAGAATSPHVYNAMTRDGATFTLELQASRVLAADAATVECIMIVARNITERTRAVERLRFQADLLETVGQAIIATDVAGSVITTGTAPPKHCMAGRPPRYWGRIFFRYCPPNPSVPMTPRPLPR